MTDIEASQVRKGSWKRLGAGGRGVAFHLITEMGPKRRAGKKTREKRRGPRPQEGFTYISQMRSPPHAKKFTPEYKVVKGRGVAYH